MQDEAAEVINRIKEIKQKNTVVDKDMRDINSLVLWRDNPRGIKEDKYKTLKEEIKEFGQFKPVLMNSGKHWGDKGVILGGNMRLRAYKELGIDKVWVSEIDPKDEKQAVKIALIDNERAGYYEEEALASLIQRIGLSLGEQEMLSVDLGKSKTLKEVLALFSPDDVDPSDATQETPAEVFIDIRTNKGTYMKIKSTLDDWENKYGIEYNVS